MKKGEKKNKGSVACQKTDYGSAPLEGLGSFGSPSLWLGLLLTFGTVAGSYAYLLYNAAMQDLEFVIGKKYVWFDFKTFTFNISIYISVKNKSKFDFVISKPLAEFAMNGQKIGDTSVTKTTGQTYNIKAQSQTSLGDFSVQMSFLQFTKFLFAAAQDGKALYDKLEKAAFLAWEANKTKGWVTIMSAMSEKLKTTFLANGINFQYKYSFQYYLLKVMPIALGSKTWDNAF